MTGLALLVATHARAQDETVETTRTAALSWVRLPGAEACPSTQLVAQAAESILGHTVFVSASSADLVIEGRVEPRAGGFRATLEVTDATGASLGERVVEADGDCAALVDPLAIVLATLVDPSAQGATDAPDDREPHDAEPIVETRVVTERVEVPVIVEVPVEVRSPPWRLDIDLGAMLVVGLTPFAAPAGHASFFFTPPGFVPIGVRGVLVPWSRAELGGGTHVDQLSFWAGIAICPLALREGRFSFAGCIGADVGGTFVIGSSPDAQPIERERFTVFAEAELRAGVHAVGPLSIALAVGLVVPFRTEGWQRGTPPSTYYVPEPVGLVVSLGPSLGFEL